VKEKAHFSSLRKLLPGVRLITNPAALIVYEVDAAQESGVPDAVIFPTSTEQVCLIAQWAVENRVPLIARGAGTGLAGGAVAERGGLLVEFSLMRQLLELDQQGRRVRVQPGMTNLELDELVKTHGLYYPPDPASGRSATLGGNVATNAGGPHCFKYGVTTNYITGLRFVLPGKRAFISGGQAYDYPEYDFASLLTGSEGTLGLITGIEARLVGLPPAVKTAMAAFSSIEQAGRAVSAVIAAGLVPSTLEMMDQKIAQIIEDYAHPGLPTEAGAILIVEVDGYPDSLEPQMAEVASILEANGVLSLKIAETAEERERIWFARKSAAGAMARLAPAYMLLDGTVPRSRLAEALEETNRICQRHDLHVGYVFHAGDGNLHPFILMYPADREQVERVHNAGREFMEAVVRLEGSITGEHGVGIEKRSYLKLMYSPAEIRAMLDVKEVFDPLGLLNPGKIFSEVEQMAAQPEPANKESSQGALVLVPKTVDEVGKMLAALSAQQKIRIASGVEEGSPKDGHVIYTRELDELVKLGLNDLYVTAGAGMKLTGLQKILAKHGKWTPLASPWEATTLGGLLAENINAPFRVRYGGIRDQVLAMTLALPDGRVIRIGRPVVKNVAGYDLARFVVGSKGTLGLIADVTLKFVPLPRAVSSLIIPIYNLEMAFQVGVRLLSTAVAASGLVMVQSKDLGQPNWEAPYAFIYTAEGHPEDVRTELGLVRSRLEKEQQLTAVEMDAFSAVQVWEQFLRRNESQFIVRLGLPLRLLGQYLQRLDYLLEGSPLFLDISSGFIYTAHPPTDRASARSWLEDLRAGAGGMGGYGVVLSCPKGWEREVDWRGYQPDTRELEKALKARWDPRGILPDF
jgi:glycolate oxidase subunit GlcD